MQTSLSRVGQAMTDNFSEALPGQIGDNPDKLTPQQMYAIYARYYENNRLYDALSRIAFSRGIWKQAMKPLRNPANRATEFHVAKLWPGSPAKPGMPPDDDAMEVVVPKGKEALADAIYQGWEWSGWGTRKQIAARYYAGLGDMFLKVAVNATGTRVFLQPIHPANVIAFDTDERGFITYIRVDIPLTRRGADGHPEAYTETEIWEKELTDDFGDLIQVGRFRMWQHTQTSDTGAEQLGEADLDVPLQAYFGIDFIPFTHAQFRNVGDERGMNCFGHALDKIDEVNLSATRLHQMLYRHNKNTWVAETAGTDPLTNRPIPPPTLSSRVSNMLRKVESDPTTIKVGDDIIVRMPGNSTLKSLVPTLDYTAALAVVQDDMGEVEKDIPELAYYQLREMGEVSGRAVVLLLSDAIDRANDARDGAYEALVRANMMMITIGQQINLFDADLGDFDNGDFAHSIRRRPVIQISEGEQAESELTMAQAKAAKADLGVDNKTLRREMGYDDEEIEQQDKDGAADAGAVQKDTIDRFIQGDL